LIVYKNLASGKNFIFLQETGNEESLFIKPPDEKGGVAIKSLKFHLFTDEPLEGEGENLLSMGAITKEQLLRYRQYKKDRSEVLIENAKDAFEQLTPWQKKELIEELLKGK
jgi:hypothetical protein